MALDLRFCMQVPAPGTGCSLTVDWLFNPLGWRSILLLQSTDGI